MAQTVIIRGQSQRDLAKRLIDAAAVGHVVTVKEETRNADQNALMWVLLSDISRAKPEGRQWVPETWKAAFMHYRGHQVHFCEALDGSGPFPMGFRTSRLTVRQMADLITTIQEYGDRHNIAWSQQFERIGQ